MENVRPEFRQDRKVIVSVRPEEFILDPANREGIHVTIEDSIFLGLNTHYF